MHYLITLLLLALPTDDPITMVALLDEMTDRMALARFPDPEYTCKQFASWDRGSVSPDDQETWFANYDRGHFLRTEENGGRKEWVMMDIDGPGAIVRIWSANPAGNIRIYLDRNPEPVIVGPMEEVLGGKWKIGDPLSAVRSRGYNLYLPIPYARHCKVTSDAEDFYYQINYRTYETGTVVETLTPGIIDSTLDQIELTGKILLKSEFIDRQFGINNDYELNFLLESRMNLGKKAEDAEKEGLSHSDETFRSSRSQASFGPMGSKGKSDELGPFQTLRLDLPEGSHVITKLLIALPETPPPHRDLVLEVVADGIQAVWCPLGDFMGAGVGADRVKDFYRVSKSEPLAAVSFWPMPYKNFCEIRLTSYAEKPVSAGIDVWYRDWVWDDRSMHFYARWRFEYPIHTVPKIDWNFVEIEGQGVFVGDQLSLMNPSEIWWGEGDEKFYVDGETFPSHFGTGTEDYYGYAWGSNQLFFAPFHGQPRCDGGAHDNCWGHTTVSRVRALDAIPFKKSLRFDMEVWHWRECDVSYAATTFFYAKPGAMHNRKPETDSALMFRVDPPPLPPPHKIEGGIECEDMEVLDHTEGIPIERQYMKPYGRKVSSAEYHLFVKPEAPGGFVEVKFPVAGKGPHRVQLYATRSWDYGIVRFFVNGTRAGEDVDLFNTEAHAVAATGPIDLGAHEPLNGAMTLRVEVVGKNPASELTGSYFALDCVVLAPEKE